MGKASRERRERVRAGLELPWVQKATAVLGRRGVIHELSKGSVDDQTARLDEMREKGALPPSNFRNSIMSNAPGEMDKGIRQFIKKGKPVTVDTLCAEVKGNQSFLKMCAGVGLDLPWFENLARERMEAHGL